MHRSIHDESCRNDNSITRCVERLKAPQQIASNDLDDGVIANHREKNADGSWQKQGDPTIDPKKNNPYYWDLQKRTPSFGKPKYSF